MSLRQEMIKLNRIRIAYSEEDRERLAADGYEPVPGGKRVVQEASGKAAASSDGRSGKKTESGRRRREKCLIR